ncbi:MAG: ATP synthase subunit I [Polyangia bacterium]
MSDIVPVKDMLDEPRLHSLERWTLGIGAVLSLVAFCFGRQAGLSVSIGAALVSLNAFAMRRVGERLWAAYRGAGSNVRVMRPLLLFNLKMVGLVAAVYLVVTYLHVNGIGLVVGLSAFPLAAVAVALTWVAPLGDAPSEDLNG